MLAASAGCTMSAPVSSPEQAVTSKERRLRASFRLRFEHGSVRGTAWGTFRADAGYE